MLDESSNNFFGSFAKASGSMSSTGRSPSRTYSAKRLKARAHTKIDDHQSRNLLQKAKGHHIDLSSMCVVVRAMFKYVPPCRAYHIECNRSRISREQN